MSTSVTSKGQVTIPKAVRDRLGLRTGSRVRFELAPDGHVMLLAEGSPPLPNGFARLRGVVDLPARRCQATRPATDQ
jgi:AbrB family looped-hinge helix DNA binding protein